MGAAVIAISAVPVWTVKAKLAIPERVRSCHTAKTGNCFIQGHVPAAAIAKLLAERPALKGIESVFCLMRCACNPLAAWCEFIFVAWNPGFGGEDDL